MSKLKAYADAKLDVIEIVEFALTELKTLWEKKILGTSILSFSHNVLKSLLTGFIKSWYDVFKHLTFSQTSSLFYTSAVQVFENNGEKGDIAHNEIVVCKLFQFGKI